MRRLIFLFLSAWFSLSVSAADAQSNIPAPNIPPLPKTNGAILALWTQFVAAGQLSDTNTAIEMRFVLQGGLQDCSLVQVREDAGQPVAANKRVTMTGGTGASSYNVTVCSWPLHAATKQARITSASGTTLAVYPDAAAAVVPGPAMLGQASGDPTRITGVALGDSGCRGGSQNCSSDWALPEMAKAAAQTNPDFVLHVGDYHYFYENDSSFWTQAGGADHFGYWLQEILVPAGPLLRAAPWIFGRGNHERCAGQWVGNAWHALFDPRPLRSATTPCTPGISPTWAVDLAPAQGNTPPFRFLVIDSANGGKANGQGFSAAAGTNAAGAASRVGWITHYPPLKMARYKDWGESHARWHYDSAAIFSDISGAVPAGAAKTCTPGAACLPSVVFSGHQHFYQEFQFAQADNQPSILIVGHGGVDIYQTQMPGYDEVRHSSSCTRDFATHTPFPVTGNEARALVRTAQVNGFLHLSRDSRTSDAGGWDRIYHWQSGAPDMTFNYIGSCPSNH